MVFWVDPPHPLNGGFTADTAAKIAINKSITNNIKLLIVLLKKTIKKQVEIKYY